MEHETFLKVHDGMLNALYWDEYYNDGYKRSPGLLTQHLLCPDNLLFDKTGKKIVSENVPATAPCPVKPADRNILFENKMLGLPRLRQVGMYGLC